MPDIFSQDSEALNKIFKLKGTAAASATSASSDAMLSKERISRAKKMMAPFVLRRKKSQVLTEIPKKIRKVEMCSPTEWQLELYKVFLLLF